MRLWDGQPTTLVRLRSALVYRAGPVRDVQPAATPAGFVVGQDLLGLLLAPVQHLCVSLCGEGRPQGIAPLKDPALDRVGVRGEVLARPGCAHAIERPRHGGLACFDPASGFVLGVVA